MAQKTESDILHIILKHFENTNRPVSVTEIKRLPQLEGTSNKLIDDLLAQLVKEKNLQTKTFEHVGLTVQVYWFGATQTNTGTPKRSADNDLNDESLTQKREQVKKLKSELDEVTEQLSLVRRKDSEFQKEHTSHLNKLHSYNDIKDIGQMLLGQLASIEGVKTKDMYQRFGMQLDD